MSDTMRNLRAEIMREQSASPQSSETKRVTQRVVDTSRHSPLYMQVWGNRLPPWLRLSPLPQTKEPLQRKENNTGLPTPLKENVEHLSGLSLEDVHVHPASPQPAQLGALAYTQGTDIYMGPGQEEHLAHEAWHVVQQKQGRVQPTLQAKGVGINDDEQLEAEADTVAVAITNETAVAERSHQSHTDLPNQETESRVPIRMYQGNTAPIQGFFTWKKRDTLESSRQVFDRYNYFKIRTTLERFLKMKKAKDNKDVVKILEDWAIENRNNGENTGPVWVEKALKKLSEGAKEEKEGPKSKKVKVSGNFSEREAIPEIAYEGMEREAAPEIAYEGMEREAAPEVEGREGEAAVAPEIKAEKMEEEDIPVAVASAPTYVGFEWQVKGITLTFKPNAKKGEVEEVESKKVIKRIDVADDYYSKNEQKIFKRKKCGIQLESDSGEIEFILDPVRDLALLQKQLEAVQKEVENFTGKKQGTKIKYEGIKQGTQKGTVVATVDKDIIDLKGTTHATLDVKLEDASDLIQYEHRVGDEVDGVQFTEEIEKKWGTLSPKVKGLVALIEFYLYSLGQRKTPHEQGPKAQLSLLVRNSFRSIYKELLSEEEQKEFAEQYVDKREKKKKPVFPHGYRVGDDTIATEQSLNIAYWLLSIIEGDPKSRTYDLELKKDMVKKERQVRQEGRGEEYDALSPPPGYKAHRVGGYTYSMGRTPLTKGAKTIQVEKRNLSPVGEENTFSDFQQQALLVARLAKLPEES